MKKRHLIEIIVLLVVGAYTYLIHSGFRFSLNPLSISYSSQEKSHFRTQVHTSSKGDLTEINFEMSRGEHTYSTNITVDADSNIQGSILNLDKQATAELEKLSEK